MNSIYIVTPGELKRNDNTLMLLSKNKKIILPIENVEDIKIFSEVNVNRNVLNYVSRYGIPIHFYDSLGRYTGTYYPVESNHNGKIFLNQVEFYNNSEKRLELAKLFVFGEIMNIKNNMDNYSKKINNKINFKEITLKIEKCRTIETLMAIEGYTREEYYKNFDSIISKDNFKFEKRSKRPPRNEINSLISFGNTLVYSDVLKNIYCSHLDPRIGYLHSTNDRGFTLNLDVAEIFKPLIIDSIIFYAVNKGLFKKNHFKNINDGVYLNEAGKKLFISLYEERIDYTVEIKSMKRFMSYKMLMQFELSKIEHHLLGDKKYFPYVEGI